MKIVSLGLLITYRCNAKCSHCAYGCHPKLRGRMKFEDAKIYPQSTEPEVVCISGGEPFLYLDLVLRIAREANVEVWIFTNCFWAKNFNTAYKIILKLKKVGVTKFFLSMDAFHQEFVPLKFVENTIQASKEIMEVEIDVRIQNSNSNINNEARKFVENLSLEDVTVRESKPLYMGRASQLAKYIPKTEIPMEKCEGIWSLGTLENPQGVDIDCFGNVLLCPGLSIGNTKKNPLSQIVENYSYKKHPIVKILVEDGPSGLLDFAKEMGFVLEKGYVNSCHLCYEVRRFLRPYFPNYLTPKNCYCD
ncbi:MAG: radical SAM protein [Candidatus Methanofastidiosia archaeon]